MGIKCRVRMWMRAIRWFSHCIRMREETAVVPRRLIHRGTARRAQTTATMDSKLSFRMSLSMQPFDGMCRSIRCWISIASIHWSAICMLRICCWLRLNNDSCKCSSWWLMPRLSRYWGPDHLQMRGLFWRRLQIHNNQPRSKYRRLSADCPIGQILLRQEIFIDDNSHRGFDQHCPLTHCNSPHCNSWLSELFLNYLHYCV